MNTNIERTQNYRLSSIEQQEFDRLWFSYPEMRRNNRFEAEALYAKALQQGATPEAIRSAFEASVASYDWLKENGRYIPGIVKWLQREKWREYISTPYEEFEEEKPWTTE